MHIRPMGKNVRSAASLDDMLQMAGLDWKVISMPVLIQGKHETRQALSYQALVRSDNGGDLLDITSRAYKPTQNRDIMGTFRACAQALDMPIVSAGSLDGGRRVFAEASLQRSFTIPGTETRADQRDFGHDFSAGSESMSGAKVGDVVELRALMSDGHVPGVSARCSLIARRLVCSNGATVSDTTSAWRMTHSQDFNSIRKAELQLMIERAVEMFESYKTKAELMARTRMDREARTAYVVELLQPELFKRVIEATEAAQINNISRRTPGVAVDGRYALDMVMAREDRLWTPALFNRPVRRVLEVMETQPGAEYAHGTAWQVYNAVTFYTDHLRGRSDETALESAYFGDGVRDKDRALELAVSYAGKVGRA